MTDEWCERVVKLLECVTNNSAAWFDMEEKKPEILSFGDIDMCNPNILNVPIYRRRRSPIIVELVDHNISAVDIQRYMEAGMNIAKFKNSLSTKGDRIRLLEKIDAAATTVCVKNALPEWPIASCASLKTCIVRTGVLEGDLDQIEFKEGDEVIMTNNIAKFEKCNHQQIFVDNTHLTIDVKVGTEISIAGEELNLICMAIVDDESIKCKVTKGGKLSNLRLVSFRGVKHSRPYITKRDLQIIRFCLEYQVDMLIISYVRHCETIRKAKKFMGTKTKRPIIFCGISTQQGLDNIDDILRECDGIVFSREFLQFELDRENTFRMAQIQKWVGAKCQQAGKPLFLSGGVLENTLSRGVLNNNEISDVTNALMDGVTGFILKDCADIENTLDSIYAFNELCCSLEPFTYSKTDFWRITDEVKMPINAAEATVMSCAAVANQTNARVIILPTVTGRTAKALLRLRPSCIIITVSTSSRTTRLLYTYRCVVPLMFKSVAPLSKKWYNNVEARIEFAVEYAVLRGWVEYGDIFITLQRGTESSSFCDTVKIWKVSVLKKSRVECEDDAAKPTESEVFKF